MDLAHILSLFDAERQRLEYPGTTTEISGAIVRHLGRYSTNSTIIYSAYAPEELDQAIPAEIDYFRALGHDFEWKVYSHDRPTELLDRLRYAGFEVGPAEAVVVAEVADVLDQLPSPSFRVERLTDPDGLDDYMAVGAQVWPNAGTGARITETLRAAPDSLGIYVAYCNDIPVGASRCVFHPDSVFAGLWGGAVLPEYRSRGIYRSMIRRRAQDAQVFGARYLQVDALPTSRPILERLGFKTLSVTHPCTYQITAADS